MDLLCGRYQVYKQLSKLQLALLQPVDFMHVFKQGILKHCLGLFMDSLTDTQKANLDSMAAYLYMNYRQTGKNII